jgi:endonuclease YncB( thermonuclease family)
MGKRNNGRQWRDENQPRRSAWQQADGRTGRRWGISTIASMVLGAIGAGTLAGWGMTFFATPTSTDFSAPASAAQHLTRQFSFCHTGGGTNCVVDGDTVWLDGTKIRIADIDAPETHPSRCAYEAEMGSKATNRLQQLLNSGPITVSANGDRDEDKYGRKLRVIELNGQSVGTMLVSEGLARPWEGHRRPWCD